MFSRLSAKHFKKRYAILYNNGYEDMMYEHNYQNSEKSRPAPKEDLPGYYTETGDAGFPGPYFDTDTHTL